MGNCQHTLVLFLGGETSKSNEISDFSVHIKAYSNLNDMCITLCDCATRPEIANLVKCIDRSAGASILVRKLVGNAILDSTRLVLGIVAKHSSDGMMNPMAASNRQP